MKFCDALQTIVNTIHKIGIHRSYALLSIHQFCNFDNRNFTVRKHYFKKWKWLRFHMWICVHHFNTLRSNMYLFTQYYKPLDMIRPWPLITPKLFAFQIITAIITIYFVKLEIEPNQIRNSVHHKKQERHCMWGEKHYTAIDYIESMHKS